MNWIGLGTGGWMWLLMFVSIGGVWGLVVLALRAVTPRASTTRSTPNSPLAVLDRRLAAGEISVAEYHQSRRALTAGHRPPR